MLNFKTAPNLNESTRAKLTALVDAMKKAGKVNIKTMSEKAFINHEDVQAAVRLMKDKDVLAVLKTQFLPAELMLRAEINITHSVAGVLCELAGLAKANDGYLIPIEPSMKMKFLYTCGHADTVIVNAPEEKKPIYDAKPVDSRTSTKETPVQSLALTSEQLFQYYKTHRAFPPAQSSESDIFNVLAYCVIDPNRSQEMLEIKNNEIGMVSEKYKAELMQVIANHYKAKGESYIASLINENGDLRCPEENFVAFLRTVAAKKEPFSTGIFLGCNQHVVTRKIVAKNAAILFDALSLDNEEVVRAIQKIITPNFTPSYNASRAPSASKDETPKSAFAKKM